MRHQWVAVGGILCILLPATAWAGEWPQFRGPTGMGLVAESHFPDAWGQDQHVAWQTALPGTGWSSPIVWGDRLFLTTAVYPMAVGWGTGSSPSLADGRLFVKGDNEQESFLLALDAATGKPLWRVRRPGTTAWSTPFIWRNIEVQVAVEHTARRKSFLTTFDIPLEHVDHHRAIERRNRAVPLVAALLEFATAATRTRVVA